MNPRRKSDANLLAKREINLIANVQTRRHLIDNEDLLEKQMSHVLEPDCLPFSLPSQSMIK